VTLSICIPVYNRVDVFSASLFALAKAVDRHRDQIEIVISDNASEDDIKSVVENVSKKFPKVSIQYNRNSENLGLAGNFLRAVELARGEYCWIVGSDDIVLNSGLESILTIIEKNPYLDFLSVEFAVVELSKMPLSTNSIDYFVNLSLNPEMIWIKRRIRVKGGEKVWDELVDPVYKNVLLGSMMCGVFRKSLWDSVDKSCMKPSASFTSIENTYPHCYIYSKCMVGRRAWYQSEPCILAGSGLRDWAGQDGRSFWLTSMPVIVMKVFTELVESYEVGGLDSRQVTKAKCWAASRIGGIFFLYLMRKYILRMRVEGSELIDERQILTSYRSNIFFYLSPLILGIKAIESLFLKFSSRLKQFFLKQ
jgi:glycosyltransferase involved in cell wall biosynthesis